MLRLMISTCHYTTDETIDKFKKKNANLILIKFECVKIVLTKIMRSQFNHKDPFLQKTTDYGCLDDRVIELMILFVIYDYFRLQNC